MSFPREINCPGAYEFDCFASFALRAQLGHAQVEDFAAPNIYARAGFLYDAFISYRENIIYCATTL